MQNTYGQAASWVGARIARPARDLARSQVFYRDLLGLTHTGGFRDHDGYDGVFFALPGGGELELTIGPAQPTGGTAEDLLVLYVESGEAVETIAGTLLAAGVRPVAAENPYWERWGRTVLDPDGYRVMIAAHDRSGGVERSVWIGWHEGSRAKLRTLFEYAEDSAQQLEAYLDLGRVLVARRDETPVGHLQLIPATLPDEVEIKNMAVDPEERGAGIGRALVEEALRRCADEGRSRMTVATAAADVGNLRFYQRLGFRFRSVERDAFRLATGYPDAIKIDGIPLLDRIWLSRDLPATGD